ncbi:hypothetical protein [Mangrovibacter phragmitis]|uniref:hypothetical protein n=1 Tax=Mangrovibacter phragmitis TaxID=1691903 RepID=UPI003369C56F
MSKITFTCSVCKTPGEVDLDDYETQEESYEDNMGKRTEYWTEIETQCENDKCGNSITIMINETEYPEGNFEGAEVNTSSGAVNVIIQ